MSLDRDVDLLARQPMLALLGRDALRLIAFAAETRILRQGEVLFRKDEPAHGALLVVEGRVALERADEGIVAAPQVGPGTLLTPLALITDTKRATSAYARESSQVMSLTRSVMHRVLAEFPDAALALHHALAQDLAEINGALADVRQNLLRIPG